MAKSNLRKIRKQKKISREELAYKCGCSATSINNYETDRNEISLSLARKIARILGASLSKLFPEQQ